MSDEDLPTPCKHADVGALQESEKKLLYGEINSIPAETRTGGSETEIAAVAGRSGVRSCRKDLPIPHHF